MNNMGSFLEIWYENVTGGHTGAALKSLLLETKMAGTKITLKYKYIFVHA
jgi:hypothetical protein